jgi:hypothetical protein
MSEKKVLCILTVWNEIDYLPLKLQFCKDNKLDLYVIDNMSNDGSWEWLQENNIPSHRIDTDDSFDLRRLQDEIVKTIHRLKPYWAIYNGCDLFPISDKPLYDSIMELDEKGYNIASIDCCGFFNTGENHDNFNPFNTFFYYGSIRTYNMIHKYHPNVRYLADNVSFPGQRVGKLNGIMINYGNTKSAEERAETLKRRRKAWDNGEPRGHGVHYITGEKLNWVRNKEDLIDVRNTKYYPYIQKLQEVSGKIMKHV